jgi:hypothetical protein
MNRIVGARTSGIRIATMGIKRGSISISSLGLGPIRQRFSPKIALPDLSPLGWGAW